MSIGGATMGAAQAGHSAEEMFEAIRAGDASRVTELLDHDPGLARVRGPEGATAILYSVYWGRSEMVALFERRGALLDLYEACAAGRRPRVETLLERAPSLARGYSSDGYPALGLAVFFGHDDIAQLLLENGADVNAASKNAQRVAPLHAAVARRNPALVRELLARGADPNAEQAGGFTPLHSAAFHGDEEIVSLLLEAGASLRTRSADGKTPAEVAREHGHPELAVVLEGSGER